MKERVTHLRGLLVDTVEQTPTRRPGRPRALIALIAGCALAGALTGGAVSAAAFSSVDALPVGVEDVDVQALSSHLVHGDTLLFGTPTVIAGSGATDAGLGDRPAGATMLLAAVRCEGTGTVDLEIDGEWQFGLECDADGGGGGTQFLTGGGSHAMHLSGSGSYLVWAQWASETPTPGPSVAQQAEIADGVATWEEYRAAFLRYADCSESAGYPMAFLILDDDEYINYGPSVPGEEAGVDRVCYAAEFAQVDELWQLAHQ